jgi:hypothetical protein
VTQLISTHFQDCCWFPMGRQSGAPWGTNTRLEHPASTPHWNRTQNTSTHGACSLPCWEPCSWTSTQTPVRVLPGHTFWTLPSQVSSTQHLRLSSVYISLHIDTYVAIYTPTLNRFSYCMTASYGSNYVLFPSK